MPRYVLTIRVTVEAKDSDDAMEMGFTLCDSLSPAGPIVADKTEPVVRNIQFNHAETVMKET